MSMTREERATKNYIQNKLAEQGYPTYASILGDFDLNLTQDPMTVGFMEPKKGRIVLNRGLDEDQVSTIVRHEILHDFLEHELRLLKHLADEHNLDFDKVDDNSLEDLKRKLYSNDLFNRAADYEISNRGYTDKDKDIVRGILLNGQELQGLVTEDDHPDWIDLSVEEMYDKLREEAKEKSDDMKPDDGDSGDGQDSSQDQSSDNSDSSQSQSSSGGGSSQSQPQDGEEQSSQGGSGNQSGDQSDNEGSTGGGGGSSQDDSDETNDEGQGQSGEGQGQGSGQGQAGDSEGGQPSSSSSSSDDDSDTPSNGKPQIGKPGNKSVLDQEDAERDAQAAEEASEYGETQESELEKQKRLERIEKARVDREKADAARNEVEDKVKKEKAARAARDANKYRSSSIKKFKDNLNRFIRNEVGRQKTKTWKREDPRYEGSGIIRRGTARNSNGEIPSINVYFDRSGSWNAEKTRVGMDAIGTLNNYVKNGQIKMNLYYFNTKIHDTDPGGSGGTRGTPIIEHIKQTRPDNVIIMTDDDITDINEYITVPGAVWLLFKGGRSRNLINSIKGKKQTNVYDLT